MTKRVSGLAGSVGACALGRHLVDDLLLVAVVSAVNDLFNDVPAPGAMEPAGSELSGHEGFALASRLGFNSERRADCYVTSEWESNVP